MNPFEQAEQMLKSIKEAVLNTPEEGEQFRIEYIGSKGKLKDLFAFMKDIPNEKKKDFGQLVNEIKLTAEQKVNEAKATTEGNKKDNEDEDLTVPGMPYEIGTRHPINIVKNEMIEIFKRLGFVVEEGPEIEDDWHNFTALNLPEHHPARDMQDTFYIDYDKDLLLRTHTSSAQIRVMERQKPPIRIITPGRVYRNETISARAHCTFHQVEGLYIDKNVSFADLKQTLYYFAKEMFGSDNIRMRPSYFPFTEPSAEIDVSCFICNAKGCKVCKHSGWVEIGGCGMVDPAVLENVGINPQEYSGFAFGMGIERITMLKYGIDDIRLFFENDVNFLKQFR
ncbi:MAG: phenylalanine--tRNA ligase subunit alpha [Chitinophagales bacterium]|nr:phenylalanine--tRNA ligase subunit alpha [Bacteroidota bacterium]MCB9225644.1 phenylalanine--tRNA ligase subunit alpha [Chitinophagales bacterium]